jgi:hypothetical protein
MLDDFGSTDPRFVVTHRGLGLEVKFNHAKVASVDERGC